MSRLHLIASGSPTADTPTDRDPEIAELHEQIRSQQQSIRALSQGLCKANNRVQALESYLSTFSDNVLAHLGNESLSKFTTSKSSTTHQPAISNTSASGFGNTLDRAKTRTASVQFQHPSLVQVETVERNPDKAIHFGAGVEGGRGMVKRRPTPKADRVAQETVLEEIANEETPDDEADWAAEQDWLKNAQKAKAGIPASSSKSSLKVNTQQTQASQGYSNKQNKTQQENPQFELSREMATFFLNAKIGRARRDAEYRKTELEMADKQKSLSELERLEWLRLERLYGSDRHKLIRQLQASMTGHYQNILQEQTTNVYPAAPLRVDNGQIWLELAQNGHSSVELSATTPLEAQ